jgi:cobalt/nickel transport system permease protein
MCFAVHISDGVLHPLWLAAGGLFALGIVFLGSRRIDDDEIPRIGLLGAAFFVASLIHVRLGPTSVHLLLNGLVGLLLGPRAGLAIGIGLLFQSLLLGHGGYTVWGINCLVVLLPALLARPGYRWLRRPQLSRLSFARPAAISFGYLFHPILAVIFGLGVEATRRRSTDGVSDFRVGFILGFVTVLLTAFLNSLCLLLAGEEDWSLIAGITLLAHLPIAILEGLVLGFVVSFLKRAKPELLP